MITDLGLHFPGPKSDLPNIIRELRRDAVETKVVLWPAHGSVYYLQDGSVVVKMEEFGGSAYRFTKFDTVAEYNRFEADRAGRFDPETSRKRR